MLKKNAPNIWRMTGRNKENLSGIFNGHNCTVFLCTNGSYSYIISGVFSLEYFDFQHNAVAACLNSVNSMMTPKDGISYDESAKLYFYKKKYVKRTDKSI